jgi:hypothetical protein
MQAAFTALLPEDLFYFTRPFFTQETRDAKAPMPIPLRPLPPLPLPISTTKPTCNQHHPIVSAGIAS